MNNIIAKLTPDVDNPLTKKQVNTVNKMAQKGTKWMNCVHNTEPY